MGSDSFFPWKSIWRVKAPLTVAFFAWIVVLGKLYRGAIWESWYNNYGLALHMYMKWGINGSFVVMSHKKYGLMFCFFGVRWFMPTTVVELLTCWMGHFGKQYSIEIWKAIHLSLMWSIWRELRDSNVRAFEGMSYL